LVFGDKDALYAIRLFKRALRFKKRHPGKYNREETQRLRYLKARFPNINIHHMRPKTRGGKKKTKDNELRVDKNWHKKLHGLIGLLTWEEAMVLFNEWRYTVDRILRNKKPLIAA
jgi:hypothetical protein